MVVSEKGHNDNEIEAQKGYTDHVYDINEKVDYNRAGAIDAENEEHRMTVWEAVKAYPSASWWAVVMSCTIVSFPHDFPFPASYQKSSLTAHRSWRPTACS